MSLPTFETFGLTPAHNRILAALGIRDVTALALLCAETPAVAQDLFVSKLNLSPEAAADLCQRLATSLDPATRAQALRPKAMGLLATRKPDPPT